ncbi:MAG: ATP-grasp domain-containing protein [Candidatus Cloacimonetes bacterium]|nr:ATP-grasp domain-containing protein [Candidatus Cloacimonadota bacterium]
MKNHLNYEIIDGPLKVYEIKAIHGANYFSGGQVIVILLDLKEYDEVFTDQIEGFYEKLKNRLPSLYDHHCSVGKPGGFFQRVKEGTLLGHVTEHTAIELQTLAGMDVGFGKTRMTSQQGVYNIVFRFIDEVAGIYTAKVAVNLINSILTNKEFDTESVINTLTEIRENRLLGPSTNAIVEEAKKRKIPFFRLDDFNLIQLGTGKFQKKLRATITSDTSLIAVETADNKYLCTLMLKDAGIPVPETSLVNSPEDIFKIRNKFPSLVIKPKSGHLGEGISILLEKDSNIQSAFHWADSYNNGVIAQDYIEGSTYRLLVINYKFVAAVKLVPPEIKGDGEKNIQQLIDLLNSDHRRNVGDKARLSLIEIDETTEKLLNDQNLNLQTVLPNGYILKLKISGNLKLGGTALDVADNVHPMNKYFSERAATIIGLNVAGIDIITPNIRDSILETDGKIIEVNAAPDFRMHLKPTFGKERNVAKNLMSMLFPDNDKEHIPTFSISGSIGKTFTVDLLAHCLHRIGYNVGKTTSKGFFINGKLMIKGELTSSKDATLLLKDPTIDCAVMETSVEGILDDGIGYEFADFGIVLNIKDIYNFKKIRTGLSELSDVAYAKSVVAEQVYDSGYVILNADDEYSDLIKKQTYSNIIYFSVEENENLLDILEAGDTLINLEKNNIFIQKYQDKKKVLNVDELTFVSENKDNLEGILAVIACLWAFKIPLKNIIEFLISYSE